MPLFNQSQLDDLFALAFSPANPGYRPTVGELPNGDGTKDVGKRFAHVAPKYLRQMANGPARMALRSVYRAAYERAYDVTIGTSLPEVDYDASCLRVLEYPAGVSSARHTDFDMFTVNIWRSHPDAMVADLKGEVHWGELSEKFGWAQATPHHVEPCDEVQRSVVFFAMPRLDRKFAGGGTVGEWVAERVARSRY